jgi:hypothetical protein
MLLPSLESLGALEQDRGGVGLDGEFGGGHRMECAAREAARFAAQSPRGNRAAHTTAFDRLRHGIGRSATLKMLTLTPKNSSRSAPSTIAPGKLSWLPGEKKNSGALVSFGASGSMGGSCGRPQQSANIEPVSRAIRAVGQGKAVRVEALRAR